MPHVSRVRIELMQFTQAEQVLSHLDGVLASADSEASLPAPAVA